MGNPIVIRTSMLLLPLLLTGCYQVRHDGGTTTIAPAQVIQVVAVAIPVAFILVAVAAIFLVPRRNRAWRRGVQIGAAAAIAVVFCPAACCVPAAFVDTITITQEQFIRRTGFWFYPNVVTVDLADVAYVAMESEVGPGGSDRNYWFAHLKNGGSTRIPPGDLGRAAESDVRLALTARGIEYR